MHRHLALLVFAASVSGCVSAPDDTIGTTSAADTTASTPDLVFDGSWGYHGDGTRTPGVIANIVYDTSRLPLCRATQDSVAAWAISAFVSADGGPAKPYPLPSGQTGTAVTVPIEVPYASDMAIWFEATDDSGCTQWDSNYGANFNFTVEDPTVSVIHFEPDFTTDLQSAPGNDYALKGGQSIDVDYVRAAAAVSLVRPGQRAGVADPRCSISSTAARRCRAISTCSSIRASASSSPGIALPAGAQTLTLWFENDDLFGCNAWDSDYGQNYAFAHSLILDR